MAENQARITRKRERRRGDTDFEVMVLARLREDPGFRALLGGLVEHPAAEVAVRRVLDIAMDADRAAGEAPYGQGFDALHAVVVQRGPGVLSAISEGVTQARVRRIEDATPPEKKTANR